MPSSSVPWTVAVLVWLVPAFWADKLKDLHWLEVPPYKAVAGEETARERATRREAVEEAVESDLLLLVIDANRDDTSEDVAFLRDWAEWYKTHPGLEGPPALVVLCQGAACDERYPRRAGVPRKRPLW